MLALEYKISGKTGTEASTKDFDVSEMTLTDLHYSGVFIGDVIFKVEVEGSVIRDYSDYSGDHPILYFAEDLFLISEKLETSTHEIYQYPDDFQEIWFHRTDRQLNIITNYSTGNMLVEFEEFKQKTKHLLLRAYENFCELYPTAVNSPALLEVKKTVDRISQ